MIALARFEEQLCGIGRPYKKVSGDMIVLNMKGQSPSVVYPLYLGENESGRGLLRGHVWFPMGSAKSIEKVDALCEILNEVLNPPRVSFDQKSRRFFIKGLIDPETFAEEETRFAFVCDRAHPLCLDVGEKGRWDTQLVTLAMLSRDECSPPSGRPQ